MVLVSVQDGSLWWKFLFPLAVQLVLFEEAVCGSSFCLGWRFMAEVSGQSGSLWWKPLFDLAVCFCLWRLKAV